MAINPETQYPGKIAPSNADYPYGSARNITVPGDGTGTPWEAALVNDMFGFQQSMLSAAGIAPSGTPEKVGASQYLEALFKLASFTFASLPALQSSPLIAAASVGRPVVAGGSLYLVTSATTELPLQNGLYAQPLDGGPVLASWVDVTGVADATSQVQPLLDAGAVVKLPAGVVKCDLTFKDGSSLLGSGSPRYDDTNPGAWDDTGTLIAGSVNVSDAVGWSMGNLSIDNFDAGGNTIAGIGARTGFGFIKNVRTRASNHGHLYETATLNALAGYDPSSGVIGNIIVEDCEHWGGPNGFVTKHHAVKFIRCRTWGVTVQGFVAVSDNINAANIFNRATDSEFIDCFSEGLGLTTGGSEGIRIYTQDRFSADPANDVNTNGVLPCDNTKVTNYRYRILAGYPIRVGDYPNPSVASLASTNTFLDGIRYDTNAFGAILLQHSGATVISRSQFNAGSNVGIANTASGVIIEDNNTYGGGNVQTGAETGEIIVNNNSNVIENRFWTPGLTYIFQNTANTLVNQVDFSIYNRPVRFVIDDTFTSINIFASQVAYKGKGTIIDAMFNGAEWVVVRYGTTKTVNEQVEPYSASVNFDFLNSDSNNIAMTLGGDLTTIDATVSGMPYGSTVALHFNAGSSTRTFAGWSAIWRFEGSSTAGNLGNPPTTLPAFTKLYIEFYIVNGLLIEKLRSEYA